MKKFLMSLVLVSSLVDCNFGLVDVEKEHKTCYDVTRVVGRDSVHVDSVAFECGDTEITTPLDYILKSPF